MARIIICNMTEHKPCTVTTSIQRPFVFFKLHKHITKCFFYKLRRSKVFLVFVCRNREVISAVTAEVCFYTVWLTANRAALFFFVKENCTGSDSLCKRSNIYRKSCRDILEKPVKKLRQVIVVYFLDVKNKLLCNSGV